MKPVPSPLVASPARPGLLIVTALLGLCLAVAHGSILKASPQAPAAPTTLPQTPAAGAVQTSPPEQSAAGQTLFAAQCGFCHGRDATGGQTGPDLTESELVASDVKGDKIAPVVRNGRVDKGMPPFNLSENDMAAVVAYIHSQKTKIDAQPGRRRRVTEADLASGTAEAGQLYFNGAGGCAKCHSPAGDLAGVGARFRGLALLQQMLYPRRTPPPTGAPAATGARAASGPAKEALVKATVTLPSGATVTGPLAYRDEFTIAVTDPAGYYRAWPTRQVKFTIENRLAWHIEQLSKYTDKDMHDVYAYLLTLR
jgi:cytochrome c oxidase cbb3-type subunit 3